MAITGSTVVVAGASGGIGRAIAVALGARGARLALLGRDAARLDETRAALGDGATAATFLGDLTARADVARIAAAVEAELGPADLLVNAAGINVARRGLRVLEPDDWDRVIAANLSAAYYLVSAFVPAMRERGSGLVVFISSLAGLRPSTVAGAAYSASKAGEAALALTLAREERGRNLRATVIYPGEVDTALLDVRAARPGLANAGAPAAPAESARPRRREGILLPEDVAAAVCFVAELPARAHVPELVIKPTVDDWS